MAVATTNSTPRSITYVRPWLYQKQSDALFCPERIAVTEATTKAGKTVGAAAWLLEGAMLDPDPYGNYLWGAPVYPQARIAFRRMKRGITDQSLFVVNESELTIRLLHNEATLVFRSLDNPDNIYGDNYRRAVIDEFTRCKDGAWEAVRSTLTHTRGPVRLIGNVKGRKNWGYRLARRAEAGEPNMHYAKITAYDAAEAGVMAWEEIEEARAQLPEAVFNELYLAVPSDDGGNPFGIDAIGACTVSSLAPGPVVAWGWDLAKSVDWSVGIGLNAAGYVCAFERFQRSWRQTIDAILTITGSTPALVDSTGVGDPILEALQAEGRANFEGYKFTAPSKQQLMEGLAVAIQHGDIRFPAGPIAAELESFEYVYTRTGVHYEAPAGVHDDCVCALALAVHLRGEQARHERNQMFRPEWFRRTGANDGDD